MKSKLGQSIIEMVFALGVIALVLTGVMALMVSNISTKNKGFDRKKATEIAQVVIEDLLQKKKSNSDVFWSLNMNNIKYPTICNPPGDYVCSVGFSIDNGSPNCVINGISNCVNAIIKVGWSGSSKVGATESVTFIRFFSKTGE